MRNSLKETKKDETKICIPYQSMNIDNESEKLIEEKKDEKKEIIFHVGLCMLQTKFIY